MKALICINSIVKEKNIRNAKKVIEKIKKENYLDLIYKQEDEKYFGKSSFDINETELVLSIGGDGTLLLACKLALKLNVPVVGINAGRSGNLCKFTLKEILNAKENPFKNLKISKRDVLSIKHDKHTCLAVNDLVFFSHNAGHTMVSKIKVGDKEIMYRASGVIISTPTGSSAYNFSMNNCLLEPDLEANIIAPIGPCGENKSNYIVDNNKDIEVSYGRPDDLIDIYVDGRLTGPLNDSVVIKKHKQKLKLVL